MKKGTLFAFGASETPRVHEGRSRYFEMLFDMQRASFDEDRG